MKSGARTSKFLIFAVAISSVLFILSGFVNAQSTDLECRVESSESWGQTTIFKISGLTNAQAELPGQTNYGYYVRCDSEDYPLSNSCSLSGAATVLRLSSQTNAHVEINAKSNYAYRACLSNTDGTSMECIYQIDSCPSGTEEVVSISGKTNAHVAEPTEYSLKVCCGGLLGCEDTDITGDYPKGKNPAEQGTCSTGGPGHTDYCTGTDENLKEWYCSGGQCENYTKDCNDYDGSNPTCSVSGSTLYKKGDDWECSGGKCQDSGSDLTLNSWTCDASRECESISCGGSSYKCYRSNAGSWEWNSPPSQETNCTDGYDNDCDGDTDGYDPDCPDCDETTCDPWTNVSCGATPCDPDEMKQTRSCTSPYCIESRCNSTFCGDLVSGTLSANTTNVVTGEPYKITIDAQDNDGLHKAALFEGGNWNNRSLSGSSDSSFWVFSKSSTGDYTYYGYVYGYGSSIEGSATSPSSVTVTVGPTAGPAAGCSLKVCGPGGFCDEVSIPC